MTPTPSPDPERPQINCSKTAFRTENHDPHEHQYDRDTVAWCRGLDMPALRPSTPVPEASEWPDTAEMRDAARVFYASQGEHCANLLNAAADWIDAHPAPSSSPVGGRVPPVHLLLDIWQALGGDSEAFHPWWAADPSFPDRWSQIVAAVAGNISDLAADSNPPAGALLDIAIQFGAADREEPTS